MSTIYLYYDVIRSMVPREEERVFTSHILLSYSRGLLLLLPFMRYVYATLAIKKTMRYLLVSLVVITRIKRFQRHFNSSINKISIN